MMRIEIIGNCAGDAEARFTQDGKEIVTLNVAVNSIKGSGEQRVERTDWFRVRVSPRQHEYVKRAFAKGSRVYVTGNLSIGNYQRRDGSEATSYDVWADEVANAGSLPESQSGNSDGGRAPAPSAAAAPSSAGRRGASGRTTDGESLDDLPF